MIVRLVLRSPVVFVLFGVEDVTFEIEITAGRQGFMALTKNVVEIPRTMYSKSREIMRKSKDFFVRK